MMNFKKISLTTIFTLGILISFWWLLKPQALILRTRTFNQLPGWHRANFIKSFQTFQISCKTFMRQNPENIISNQLIKLQVKDWQPACKEALTIKITSNQEAKNFFQKWLLPVEYFNARPLQGLFTGYYMPHLQGSLIKTKEFNIPIYGLPDDLIIVNLGEFKEDLRYRQIIGRIVGKKLIPFYTREEIVNGALYNKSPILLWVNSVTDRLFLEIQGSGVVSLPNGQKIYLGYAGENGAPYTAIGRVLVERGIMTKETVSMQGIRTYLEAHPQEIKAIINQNKSFVFFQVLSQKNALGAQGVPLTAGYSLAVDRQWIPLGTPIWLNTTRPTKHFQDKQVLQRLMIAQDTGGAIRGMVRGDIFWGASNNAANIAGKMKNTGYYWLLLPKHIIPQLPKKLAYS